MTKNLTNLDTVLARGCPDIVPDCPNTGPDTGPRCPNTEPSIGLDSPPFLLLAHLIALSARKNYMIYDEKYKQFLDCENGCRKR